MGIWEIIVGILVLILSIIMVIVIILQEGHQAGLGTVTGGADSFLSRGKARTADAIFARVTRYCAITFFVLVIVLNALSFFGLTGSKVDDNKAAAESSAVIDLDKESSKSEETSKTEGDASKSESQEASKEESKSESKEESKSESKTESKEASAAESKASDEQSKTSEAAE